MASKQTLFNQVKEMNDLITPPVWDIGFKYIFLDDKDSIDIDLLFLMKHYGYIKEYELCHSYYEKYPNSVAMPMSQGIDNFFNHLKDLGIYEKTTAPFGGLEQTAKTRHIYEEICSIVDTEI